MEIPQVLSDPEQMLQTRAAGLNIHIRQFPPPVCLKTKRNLRSVGPSFSPVRILSPSHVTGEVAIPNPFSSVNNDTIAVVLKLAAPAYASHLLPWETI